MRLRRNKSAVALRTAAPVASTRKPELGLAKRVPRAELFGTAVLGGVGVAIEPRLGIFTWSVGILLALNQMRSEAKAEKQFEHLKKLTEIIDLSADCDIAQLREVIDAYLRIPEPEFLRVKAGILSSTRDELLRLANEKSSGDLSSGPYYRWLLPMLEDAAPGSTIRALSLMMTCEWDDSPSERQFIELNKAAARRGVRVERIFVMPRGQLVQALRNPAVRWHLMEEDPPNLLGYVVDFDWLARNDKPLAAKLGDGFIDFHGAERRVALVDLHSVDGSIRGAVTMLPAQLAKLREIHDTLLVHAEELSLQLLTAEEAREFAAETGTEQASIPRSVDH